MKNRKNTVPTLQLVEKITRILKCGLCPLGLKHGLNSFWMQLHYWRIKMDWSRLMDHSVYAYYIVEYIIIYCYSRLNYYGRYRYIIQVTTKFHLNCNYETLHSCIRIVITCTLHTLQRTDAVGAPQWSCSCSGARWPTDGNANPTQTAHRRCIYIIIIYTYKTLDVQYTCIIDRLTS